MKQTGQSEHLAEALSIQELGFSLAAMRDSGQSQSETFETLLECYVGRRKELVSKRIDTPLDALVVAHTMEQCVNAIGSCAQSDEAVQFQVLAVELLLAVRSLIPFAERQAAVSRNALNLYSSVCAGKLN